MLQNLRLLEILSGIIGLLPQDVLQSLWRMGYKLLYFHHPQGIFEVLEYDSCLELLDPKAKRAMFYRRQKVRFLQNNVIAYQDQAWGEGEIFADYRCSPGVAVDRYQDGNSFRVLISLRGTRNRGDVEDIHIWREIHDGFPHDTENFQNKVNHLIHDFRISIIFPSKRHPKRITMIQENTAQLMPLQAEHIRTLPDGRQKVTWETTRPKRHELYSFHWEW
jgi:hypothetical protein